MNKRIILLKRSILFILIAFITKGAFSQQFLHPGINQSLEDLVYMKKVVLKGDQPYKDAFQKLKLYADSGFIASPHTHVLRGPYGRPNIGGDDLSKSAEMAYNYALVWYITNDTMYAKKAISIINSWSSVLWHFDYNDAKLLAAWTGHKLCNAAEILRYTNSGWRREDIDKFTNMLMTVYYPLIRFYYPQANGNWDGAIIHSIMAIAIFTDRRELFDNAVNHFLRGPVNGSIFKYVHPSGQCQESTRDQAHVQLGLGEFTGAAQIAFTQGVDLFSVGDNRLALGYEYTARFLLGEKPHAYGIISERAKTIRDDYEYIYRHYKARGVDLTFSGTAADSARLKASRSILTAIRAPSVAPKQNYTDPRPGTIGYIAGAGAGNMVNIPADAIVVSPGQSVQQALHKAAGASKWVVLEAGIHTLPASLRLPSGVTICGKGLGTVVFLDPATGIRDAIVNENEDMHDITIRNLVIEGAVKTDPGTDPNNSRSYRSTSNRGGIVFRSTNSGQMRNINLINVTVQNCTYNGIFISGGFGINITGCDVVENGSSVVPGPKLQHNVLLTHCSDIKISGSRLDTSPYGSGVALDHCLNATITDCEIARNAYYGLLVSECNNVSASKNLVEANDRSGVMMEFLHKGTEDVKIIDNIIRFNGGYGIESYAARKILHSSNNITGNGKSAEQVKQSNEKRILIE